MRHLVRGRRLNRSSPHRTALFRNLARALVAHERIETTIAKAREIRPYAERLVTIAKRGLAAAAAAPDEKAKAVCMLTARRRLIQKLGGAASPLPMNDGSEIKIVDKLLSEIGPRFANRPGGYTRLVKLTKRRVGDASELAYVEFLSANEPEKDARQSKKGDKPKRK